MATSIDFPAAPGLWAQVDEIALSPLLAPGPLMLAEALVCAATGVARHPGELARHSATSRSAREWIAGLVDVANLDEGSAQRARIALDALTEALRPNHVLPGNPTALRRAWHSRGRSLWRGARAFAEDMARYGGLPALADRDALRLGRDLAATPGSVVHRGPMFELLRYLPADGTALATPVLIVPSQVNKFYVVDLTPGQSLVRHLVDAGLQVFVLSWRNPTPRERSWSLADYVECVEAAMDRAIELSGSDRLHLVGMCAGAISAAVAGVADRRDLVASFSSVVGMLDTRNRSALGAFVTPRAARTAAARSRRRGVLSASDLARAFALARSRELFWTPWERNYLLGADPPAHPVLYWSQDSANLPAALHADLLDLLVGNKLATSGALTVRGRPVDLRALTCDAFFLGGSGDHLVPAAAVANSAQLVGGTAELVIADGGHIRSLLAGYPRSAPAPFQYATVRRGRAMPTLRTGDGGWWSFWSSWLTVRSGARRQVVPGDGAGRRRWPAAPGAYVLEHR